MFFRIYFDLKDHNYYIDDLESGQGTFIKVENEYKLQNNTLINIGDTYLVVTFGDLLESEDNENRIKFFNKTNNINEGKICIKVFSGLITNDQL